MYPAPSCSAVLFADQIIVDAETGKKTLVGLYSNIYSSRLPLRKKLNIFVDICDACGRYDFELELIRLEDEAKIASGAIKGVNASDRLSSVEVIIQLAAAIRSFGTYEFRMLYGNNLVASKTFRVLEKKHHTVPPM
jgi:hypothetical protein